MIASAVARQPLPDVLEAGPRVWEDLLDRMESASPLMSWNWHRAWIDSAAVEEAKACEAIVLIVFRRGLDADPSMEERTNDDR